MGATAGAPIALIPDSVRFGYFARHACGREEDVFLP